MNARVYGWLLSFYPVELREKFGAEMTEVFLEDLEERQRRGGMMGAVRVWWRSVREFCRIALPEGASRCGIAVPLIMYVAQVCYFSSVIFRVHRDPHNTLPKSAMGIMGMMLIGAIFPAVIARIAQLVGDASVPARLRVKP